VVSDCLMMTGKFAGLGMYGGNVPRDQRSQLGVGVASGLSRFKSGEGGDGIREWICQPLETLAQLKFNAP
jgi:hypothetical protein